MTTYAGRPVFAPYFTDPSGNPQELVSITVYNRGTVVKPTLYTSRTKATPLANPFTADSLGNANFYVDPGEYDALVNGVTLPFSSVPDPVEPLDDAAVLAAIPSGTFAGVYSKVPAAPSGDDTAGLQAKLQESVTANVPMELPASRTYHITDTLVVPDEALYIKIFGGSRRGARIVQQTPNKPILLWDNIAALGGGANGTQIQDLALEFEDEATDATTQQWAIQLRPNPDGTTVDGAGFYNATFRNLEIVRAYLGIGAYTTGAGTMPIWHTLFDNIQMSRIKHSLLRLNGGGGSSPTGAPSITINHLSGTNSGDGAEFVSDGPALDLGGIRGLVVNTFNLEDWHNKAILAVAGGSHVYNGIRLERHRLTGDYPIVIDISDGQRSFHGLDATFYQKAGQYARLVQAANCSVEMEAVTAERDVVQSTTASFFVLAAGNPADCDFRLGSYGLTGTNFIEALPSGYGTGCYVRTESRGRAPVVDALPVASATYRGRRFRTEGGVGVADVESVCLKNGADAYAWVPTT